MKRCRNGRVTARLDSTLRTGSVTARLDSTLRNGQGKRK